MQLAEQMGDDSRVSLITANLCALYTLQGRFREAIETGLRSIEVGARLLSQPRITNSYTNLAEAYMLSGQRDQALECLDAAKRLSSRQVSWRASVDFLCESANLALMMDDVSLALNLIGSIEGLATGREGAVPERGMFEKLRVFRAAHLEGYQSASTIAREALQTFRGRHSVYYLEALAASAWVEKRTVGLHTAETEEGLQSFQRLGAHGLKASLTAQGFLC
jgi:tetratricopeptide (TPR) repeat protein